MRKGNGENVLLELERRGSRSMLPLSRRTAATWAALMLAALLVAQLFLKHTGTIESHFMLGALLAFSFSTFGAAIQAMTLWENGFKDWWLTLPYPRRSLLRAKALALMESQLWLAGAMWLVCLTDGVLRVSAGVFWDDPGAGGRLPGDALAYALLYAALVPLGSSIGYLLLGLYYGWRRWLLIPFIVLIGVPFSLFSLLTGNDATMGRWLSANVVFIGALIALAAGAALYRAMLAFATRYGMRDLARHRPGGLTASVREEAGSAERFRLAKGGFASVYALERSRFVHFGSLKAFRIVYASAIALFGIGSYFASTSQDGFYGVLQMALILMLIGPIPVLTTLNQNEANKRRFEWWLGMPYGRRTLLWARVTALWVSVFRWFLGALAAFAAGSALQAVTLSRWTPEWHRDGPLLAYLFLLFLGGGFLLIFVPLVQPLTYRSSLYAWLSMPLTVGIFFAPMAINEWLVTDEIRADGVHGTQWLLLGAVLALCLVIAVLTFRAGARWMHLYLLNTTDAAQRRRGSQTGGKF